MWRVSVIYTAALVSFRNLLFPNVFEALKYMQDFQGHRNFDILSCNLLCPYYLRATTCPAYNTGELGAIFRTLLSFRTRAEPPLPIEKQLTIIRCYGGNSTAGPAALLPVGNPKWSGCDYLSYTNPECTSLRLFRFLCAMESVFFSSKSARPQTTQSLYFFYFLIMRNLHRAIVSTIISWLRVVVQWVAKSVFCVLLLGPSPNAAVKLIWCTNECT